MTQAFDFGKLFAQFGQFGAFDNQAVRAAYQRNVDATVKTLEILSKTGQDLVQLQADIARANLLSATEYTKTALNTQDVNAALNNHVAFVRQSTETAASQVRQVVELATKGGTEAAAVLRQRAEEGVQEVQTVANDVANRTAKAAKNGTAAAA